MQDKSITSFPEVLAEMRGGRTVIELSERITEVVAAVQATGKAGKVSIELAIVPAHKGEVIDQFYVRETIKHTIPEKDKADTLYMMNHEGVLQSFASRQIQLELKSVESIDTRSLKEI